MLATMQLQIIHPDDKLLRAFAKCFVVSFWFLPNGSFTVPVLSTEDVKGVFFFFFFFFFYTEPLNLKKNLNE